MYNYFSLVRPHFKFILRFTLSTKKKHLNKLRPKAGELGDSCESMCRFSTSILIRVNIEICTYINYNVKLFIEDALCNWGNEPFELNSTVVAMPQPQKPLCFSS
eukprot:sb/3478166/